MKKLSLLLVSLSLFSFLLLGSCKPKVNEEAVEESVEAVQDALEDATDEATADTAAAEEAVPAEESAE